MENTITVALHGFLGHPDDWQTWHKAFGSNSTLYPINLWNHPTLNSDYSINDWTVQFTNFVYKLKKSTGATIKLCGYSMGGRLALGALMAKPELYSSVTIISANPGLETQADRLSRFERDREWAQRFLQDKWSEVIDDWNSQPVLRESNVVDNSVNRREEDYTREGLSQALLNWSIALQPNYWTELSRVKTKIEWHVGELDSTYLAIGQRVTSINSTIKLTVHPNRGHRLLLNP